jgi:predicted metalloprotease with PDZ domain
MKSNNWNHTGRFLWAILMLVAVLALQTQPALAQEDAEEDEPLTRLLTLNEHGYLGVTLKDLEADDRRELKYDGAGVMIEEILDDSPADEAGLHEDDIIIRFNDRVVENEEQLRELIADTESGDKATVQLIRDGQKKDVEVTLGSSAKALNLMMDGMQRPLQRMFMRERPCDENQAWLGVEVQALSDQLKDYFKVKGDRGVLVSGVQEASPAEKAGIKAGDVIVSVGGEDVRSRADIRQALCGVKEGSTVAVELVRNSRYKTLQAHVVWSPEGCSCSKPMMKGRKLGKTPHIMIHKEKMDRAGEPERKVHQEQLEYDAQMDGLKQSIDELQNQIDALRKDLTEFHDQF